MKARSIIVLFAFFTVFHLAQAQVQVKLQQPPPNQLRAADLWKLTLNNTTRTTYNIKLEGTLDEAGEGRVATGNSGIISLPPGTKAITYDDVKRGGSVNFKSGKWQEAFMRTGNAPSGNYTICIYVKTETGEELGRDCIEQNVEIVSGPTLISPADGETIPEGQTPTFTWLPSTPAPRDVKYSLKIVEIADNQSPIEAIKRNVVQFEKREIGSTTFQYPLSAKKFEKGKKYAWQVSIGDLKSEAWMFSVGNQSKLESLTPKNNATFRSVKEMGSFSWSLEGDKIDKPQYEIELLLLDKNKKTKRSFSGKTTDTKIAASSVFKADKPDAGQYQWKVTETTTGISSSPMLFDISASCGTDSTTIQINCDKWIEQTGLPQYTVTLKQKNIVTTGSLGCPIVCNSVAIHPAGSLGTISNISPALPITIMPGSTSTITFSYSPPNLATTSVSFRAFGIWQDGLQNDPSPNTANPLATIDTLPGCLCKDCDSMVVNYNDFKVTPNGTTGNQYNIAGNLSVNKPIYGLEFQLQSYSYTATPSVCTNGVSTIGQSGMFLMPGTTINGTAAIQVFNETVSGSPNTNNNASKDVKLMSTTPLTGNIPVNFVVGLPGPLSGLAANCCAMKYNVCIKVKVFYDKESCKSCTFTHCFEFNN